METDNSAQGKIIAGLCVVRMSKCMSNVYALIAVGGEEKKSGFLPTQEKKKQ